MERKYRSHADSDGEKELLGDSYSKISAKTIVPQSIVEISCFYAHLVLE